MRNVPPQECALPAIGKEAFTAGRSHFGPFVRSEKSWGCTNGPKSLSAGQLFNSEFAFLLKNPERNFFVL